MRLVCVRSVPSGKIIVTTMLVVITNTFMWDAPYAFPMRVRVSSTRFTSAPLAIKSSPISSKRCKSEA